MNPTSQHLAAQLHHNVSPGVPTRPPTAQSLSASLAVQQQIQRQIHQQLLLPHPGLSGGSINSKHINWVTTLRTRKGRWVSEVQQEAWTQTENDYYEFTYELFQSGFVEGVEVGLPVRFFMSELLGCSAQRVDLKLMEDKRVPDLRCPRIPQRELVECERQGLIKKLHRLERAFLMRERGSLHDRVRYNAPEDASRFISLAFANIHSSLFHPVDLASSSGGTSVAAPLVCSMPITSDVTSTLETPATAGLSMSAAGVASGAAYAAQMVPISTAREAPMPNPAQGPTAPSTQAMQQQVAAVQQWLQPNGGCSLDSMGSAASVVSMSAGPVTTASTTMTSSNPVGTAPARDANAAAGSGGSYPLEASSVESMVTASVTSSSQTSTSTSTPSSTTSFVDPNGRVNVPTPATMLPRQQDQGKNTPAAFTAPSAAVRPNGSYSQVVFQGEALGRKLLGVPRKGIPGVEPPSAKRRTSCLHPGASSSVSGTADANGGDMFMENMPESAEDEAAMEYLKWELHGKFMAFPGEHYHNLLSCLASEIYHNRYPVEHGVDVLHAVMREAGPGASQKCAKTLRMMNLPTKMMP